MKRLFVFFLMTLLLIGCGTASTAEQSPPTLNYEYLGQVPAGPNSYDLDLHKVVIDNCVYIITNKHDALCTVHAANCPNHQPDNPRPITSINPGDLEQVHSVHLPRRIQQRDKTNYYSRTEYLNRGFKATTLIGKREEKYWRTQQSIAIVLAHGYPSCRYIL
jgi:hypothetical protein